MATNILKERFVEIESLAHAMGLDYYDMLFFEVPQSMIYQAAAYGLPTRYSHWSHGKMFQYQRTQGEMGFSKIYEMIFNASPAVALLDVNNTDVTNLMIAAHCAGHSHFFKQNILFRKNGETNMIHTAKLHAEIIDNFRNDYGDDEVDDWLDLALALERHIDVYRGFHRKKYDTRHVEYEERVPTEWEDIVEKEHRPLLKRVVKGIHVPPHPEKDLLWFLSEYANLEPWQKQVFEIVRRESYYFFPQHQTKIINEGMACYAHTEIMCQYALGDKNEYGVEIKHPLSAAEHLDFVALHEKVVQPGMKFPLKVKEVDNRGRPTGKKVWNPILNSRPGLFNKVTRINPYYVGYKILQDIKKRWDEYYKQGYMEDEMIGRISVTTTGAQKVLEVVSDEDDVSLLRKYLTEELCEELHLFAYGSVQQYCDDYETQEDIQKRISENPDDDLGEHGLIDQQIIHNKTVAVKTKEIKDIVNYFAKSNSNYGVPLIVVRRIDENGLLRLEHMAEDSVNIDIKYAEQVLKYVGRVWSRPVELIRKGKDKTWVMRYDGMSFEVDYEAPDYPEIIENNQIPSSW